MRERENSRTLNSLMQFIQRLYLWIQRKLEKGMQWFSALLGDNKQKNNIAVLDGVRAMACLLVLFFHVNVISRDGHTWQVAVRPLTSAVAGSIALAGSSGVTLFFVLSGFLLFLPYAKSLLFESMWPSARLFYLRRALRIVPAYYAALFLIILLFHPQYLQPNHWKDVGLFLIFFIDAPQTYHIWYHHYVFHSLDRLFHYYDWLSEFVLSMGFALSVAAVLFGPAWLKAFFAWTPLRWIGLISFSLYIWHVPLLQFFRVDISHQLPGWRHLAVYGLYWLWALSVIIPIALLSYVWIEKPWMAIGERFRRRGGSEKA